MNKREIGQLVKTYTPELNLRKNRLYMLSPADLIEAALLKTAEDTIKKSGTDANPIALDQMIIEEKNRIAHKTLPDVKGALTKCKDPQTVVKMIQEQLRLLGCDEQAHDLGRNYGKIFGLYRKSIGGLYSGLRSMGRLEGCITDDGELNISERQIENDPRMGILAMAMLKLPTRYAEPVDEYRESLTRFDAPPVEGPEISDEQINEALTRYKIESIVPPTSQPANEDRYTEPVDEYHDQLTHLDTFPAEGRPMNDGQVDAALNRYTALTVKLPLGKIRQGALILDEKLWQESQARETFTRIYTVPSTQSSSRKKRLRRFFEGFSIMPGLRTIKNVMRDLFGSQYRRIN